MALAAIQHYSRKIYDSKKRMEILLAKTSKQDELVKEQGAKIHNRLKELAQLKISSETEYLTGGSGTPTVWNLATKMVRENS